MISAILKTKNERILVDVDFSARAGTTAFNAIPGAAAVVETTVADSSTDAPTIYQTEVDAVNKKVVVGIAGGRTDVRYLLRVRVNTDNNQTLEIARYIDVIDIF